MLATDVNAGLKNEISIVALKQSKHRWGFNGFLQAANASLHHLLHEPLLPAVQNKKKLLYWFASYNILPCIFYPHCLLFSAQPLNTH